MPMGDALCHNCSGLGHMQRNCPSPRRPRQQARTVNKNTAPDTESRPPIEPSVAQVLQGIGPGGLAGLGEVSLQVQVGSRATNVNFIMANTAESTEVILGHPFLHQTSAQLDYGHCEITLCGEKVPCFNPSHQSQVHILRVARTTVLVSGCEYVVPGTTDLRLAADGDLMLSPTKGSIEKHHVLVAHIIVQAQRSTNVPIRVFNPGALPVTLKRGAVAGILQLATVLEKLEPQPPLAPPASAY
ncbi:unnamed protein product [Gadus morhua 'NCC']